MNHRTRIPAAKLVLGLGALITVAASLSTAARAQEVDDDTLTIVTVPALPGTVFRFDDRELVADESGQIIIQDAGLLRDAEERLEYVRFDGDQTIGVTFEQFAGIRNANRSRLVEAVFETTREVQFTFADLEGRPVDLERITLMSIKNSLGVFYEFDPQTLQNPVVLPSERAIQTSTGYLARPIFYTVQDVQIDGSNTVNRSQQRFLPNEVTAVNVQTQFYHVKVELNDALFSFPNGDAVLVRWPDGQLTRHSADSGPVSLYLPRGDYSMRVDGSGLRTWRPVSVSRDQLLELKLFSFIDILILVLGGLAFAVVAIAIGRVRVRNRRDLPFFLAHADPNDSASRSNDALNGRAGHGYHINGESPRDNTSQNSAPGSDIDALESINTPRRS